MLAEPWLVQDVASMFHVKRVFIKTLLASVPGLRGSTLPEACGRLPQQTYPSVPFSRSDVKLGAVTPCKPHVALQDPHQRVEELRAARDLGLHALVLSDWFLPEVRAASSLSLNRA